MAFDSNVLIYCDFLKDSYRPLLKEVYDLFVDDKTHLAYRTFQLLSALITSDEQSKLIDANVWLTQLFSDASDIDYIHRNLQTNESWTEVENSHGCRVLYRREEGRPIHSIALHGDLYCDVQTVVTLLMENDLIPLITDPNRVGVKRVKKLTKFGQLIHMWLGLVWPVSDRDVCVEAKAADLLEDGSLVIVGQPTPPTPEEWRERYRSDDFLEDMDNTVRMTLSLSGGILRVLSPKRLLVSGMYSVNPNLAAVPQTLINYMSRSLAHFGFCQVRGKLGSSLRESEFFVRMCGNNAFYTEAFVRSCVSVAINWDNVVKWEAGEGGLIKYLGRRQTFVSSLTSLLSSSSKTSKTHLKLSSEQDSDSSNPSHSEDHIPTSLTSPFCNNLTLTPEILTAFEMLKRVSTSNASDTAEIASSNTNPTSNSSSLVSSLVYLGQHAYLGALLLSSASSPHYVLNLIDPSLLHAGDLTVRLRDSYISKQWRRVFVCARQDGVYLADVDGYVGKSTLGEAVDEVIKALRAFDSYTYHQRVRGQSVCILPWDEFCFTDSQWDARSSTYTSHSLSAYSLDRDLCAVVAHVDSSLRVLHSRYQMLLSRARPLDSRVAPSPKHSFLPASLLQTCTASAKGKVGAERHVIRLVTHSSCTHKCKDGCLSSEGLGEAGRLKKQTLFLTNYVQFIDDVVLGCNLDVANALISTTSNSSVLLSSQVPQDLVPMCVVNHVNPVAASALFSSFQQLERRVCPEPTDASRSLSLSGKGPCVYALLAQSCGSSVYQSSLSYSDYLPDLRSQLQSGSDSVYKHSLVGLRLELGLVETDTVISDTATETEQKTDDSPSVKVEQWPTNDPSLALPVKTSTSALQSDAYVSAVESFNPSSSAAYLYTDHSYETPIWKWVFNQY